MNQTVVAVSGASGFLGGRLLGDLKKRGAGAVAVSRSRGGIQADLKAVSKEELAESFRQERVSAFVHCAYDFSQMKWEDIKKANMEGSIAMIGAALDAQVQGVVFISSLSAFPGCRSMYGRAKLVVEEHFAREPRVSVLRPGLIYSREPGGIVGKMAAILIRAPVVPLIGNGRQISYTCHLEDLLEVIAGVVLSGKTLPASPIPAASPVPHAFVDILRVIARAKERSVRFLPVPSGLVWAGLKVAEAFGLSVGFRSDSVVSLQNQSTNPGFVEGWNNQNFREISERDFLPA